jgi:hypothetical protein
VPGSGPTKLPYLDETQFLLGYEKMVRSSVQHLGHPNLPEETKVIAIIFK